MLNYKYFYYNIRIYFFSIPSKDCEKSFWHNNQSCEQIKSNKYFVEETASKTNNREDGPLKIYLHIL